MPDLPNQDRQTSPRGIDLIKLWEGLQLSAYLDTAGVPTIGYGHTKDVKMGATCTESRALTWLVEDLRDAESAVGRLVHPRLTQSMFDATVSFQFNTGGLLLTRGQPSRFLAALNDRRWADAGEELVHWNIAGGRPSWGLCRRRAAELTLFHRERWPS